MALPRQKIFKLAIQFLAFDHKNSSKYVD